MKQFVYSNFAVSAFACLLMSGAYYSAYADEGNKPVAVTKDAVQAIDDDIYFTEEMWHKPILGDLDKVIILPKDMDVKIPLPPKNSSKQVREELDYMLELQRTQRTAAKVEEIEFEHGMGYYAQQVFTREGLLPSKEEAPALHEIFGLLATTTSYFIVREKYHFNRARPTQLEERLTTVVPVPRHASYPSGHSTQGYSTGLLLSRLDPAHKEEYLQLGTRIGTNRELAGVHYPSDTAAGKIMATNIINAFMEHEDIKALIPKAREELLAYYAKKDAR